MRVIAPADESADAAARVVDHNHRTLEIMHGRIALPVFGRFVIRFKWMVKIGLMLDFRELLLERVLRGILHCRIKRRVNGKPSIIHLVFGEDLA